MKRCPQCNRVETDDALVFCRADGTALISDSGSIRGEGGTAKLASGGVSSEIETSILPQTSTTPEINRATAPTTVLPATQIPSTTPELSKPSRRGFLIAVLVLVVVGFAIAGYVYFSRQNNATIQSIAVMPFVNASATADLDYLSDGMTETLIRSLSQLPNLNVKARSSVFRYKGKATEAKSIGKELNVQAILNGRVVQRGDALTLSLELINAETENVIWTDQYDRKSRSRIASE
jgi:TolB-like protein